MNFTIKEPRADTKLPVVLDSCFLDGYGESDHAFSRDMQSFFSILSNNETLKVESASVSVDGDAIQL